MAKVTVRELNTYPVKGCGGGPVQELVLTEQGIDGDREYSFVGEDGKLVDQKKTPILASISAELAEGELVLRHAGQGLYKHQPRLEGKSVPATWVIDQFEGIDQGDEVADWVSRIIDKSVRLIRADKPWTVNFPVPSMKRVHGKPKQKFNGATDVSLTNLASLEALNRNLDVPIGMDRFRTNIVVDGIAAYEEDHMDLVGNDMVEIMQVTPAERCEIITTDQMTGERPQNNILKVLGQTRYKTKDRFGTGLLFGNYMRVSKPGILRIGDVLALRDMTEQERLAAEG
jgi:uncharacterized protein YcbX